MKNIIVLNKKEGETPLAALENFRFKNKEYKDVKMTYAGRLDPMASGLLLVLVGDEIKKKEKYLSLDKEYEFEILFGVATDTYDILGKISKFTRQDLVSKKELEKEIKENIKFFTGKFVQKYPIYSSKTILGKQLFKYAREGIMVDLPEREVFVKELKFLKLRKINSVKLLVNIGKRIKKVKGDFRQKEILKIWRRRLTSRHRVSAGSLENFYIGSFKIKCSSGTYVRGIGSSLGEKMGIPALVFSIERTKIGIFSPLSKQ